MREPAALKLRVEKKLNKNPSTSVRPIQLNNLPTLPTLPSLPTVEEIQSADGNGK